MKWRSSIIYLILFFLIGGYFYYFEVVRKEQKQAAEKESKRIFHFNKEEISSVEITSKEKNSVLIRKDSTWKIQQPVNFDVDKQSVDSVLAAVSNLEKDREVDPAPSDLKPFGLDDPALRIRFQDGEKQQEILLGNKNPTGDGYYAKTGDKENVMLVAAGNWGALNKGVDDLRKKELFSFKTDDVKGLRVAWEDGKAVDVEETPEGIWKAPAAPEMKIKRRKVENVLEQIKWLRAVKFLENDTTKLESSGLKPSLVTVKMQLKNGEANELLIGKKEKDEKQVAALSSELPAIVTVHGDVLDDLPKNVQALEDRSLLSINSETIKQIKWRLGEADGQVVQMGEGNWGVKKDDNEPKPLKESWHVRSLLWDMKDSEYVQKVDPTPNMPEHPHVSLEFSSGDKNITVMKWDKHSDENTPVTVWLTEGGDSRAVQVETKVMGKIEQDLVRLSQPEGDKETS